MYDDLEQARIDQAFWRIVQGRRAYLGRTIAIYAALLLLVGGLLLAAWFLPDRQSSSDFNIVCHYSPDRSVYSCSNG